MGTPTIPVEWYAYATEISKKEKIKRERRKADTKSYTISGIPPEV